jgi:hypothetical protein
LLIFDRCLMAAAGDSVDATEDFRIKSYLEVGRLRCRSAFLTTHNPLFFFLLSFSFSFSFLFFPASG